jgi:tetratricopeptide (TPR) repeat protein
MYKSTKMSSMVVWIALSAGVLYAAAGPTGYFGAIVRDADDSVAARLGLKEASGVLVVDVVKGSPAGAAGLLKDDVLLKINGLSVRDTAYLWKMIRRNPGAAVKIEGIRSSAPLVLKGAFGSMAENNGSMSHVTLAAFKEESAGDQEEKAGNSRKAVDHYLNALEELYRADEIRAGREGFPGLVIWQNVTIVQGQKLVSRHLLIDMGDDNIRVRQKIIVIVQRMEAPPAIPENADRAMVIARATQAEAKDNVDYVKAILKYSEASRCAPWLADLYFNLGVLSERMGYLQEAIGHYKLYLVAAPGAEDAQKVREKIYVLEDKQKEQAVAPVSAAKAPAAKSNWTQKDTREVVQLSLALVVIIILLITHPWTSN